MCDNVFCRHADTPMALPTGDFDEDEQSWSPPFSARVPGCWCAAGCWRALAAGGQPAVLGPPLSVV